MSLFLLKFFLEFILKMHLVFITAVFSMFRFHIFWEVKVSIFFKLHISNLHSIDGLLLLFPVGTQYTHGGKTDIREHYHNIQQV